MGLTAELSSRIAVARFDDLPPEAVAAARRLVLDGLAVALAGAVEEDAIPIMAAHYRRLGGEPQCTAIGCGFRTDPVRAAALNGAAMHVLDFEPMWSPATHALSTTLPVALALAEARGAPGREVLTALVKGIEIQGWLREASGQFTPDVLQFHPPGLVGPMGAVAAAGHLLGLDAGRLANAFGIAASRAGSVFGNVGTMTKSTHCGQAGSLGPRSGAPRGIRLHRRRGDVRISAGLRCDVLPRDVPAGRVGEVRPAPVARGAARLCDQDVPQPVRHAFRHHRRADAATSRFPIRQRSGRSR